MSVLIHLMLADRNSSCYVVLLLVASNIWYTSWDGRSVLYVRCSNVTCHKSKLLLLTFLMSYVMCDVRGWLDNLCHMSQGVPSIFFLIAPRQVPQYPKSQNIHYPNADKTLQATPLHPITECINTIPLIITKSTLFHITYQYPTRIHAYSYTSVSMHISYFGENTNENSYNLMKIHVF